MRSLGIATPMIRSGLLVMAVFVATGCFVTDAELRDALDRDGDGYQPVVAGGPDCDESSASVNPGATEVCGDGIDNDCDGFIDDDGVGARVWYRDEDGDGFGIAEEVSACTEPEGYAPLLGDCDDGDPAFNPAVDDLCDGLDQDCDGVADDEVPLVERYRDADGDGFGSPTDTTLSCDEQPGYVNQAGDCDDGNASINPAAEDFCDGEDQNCNALIDESASFTVQYRDSDGDGFGSADETIEACAPVAGFASNSDDCDDAVAGVNPLADDLCDGVDQDCDTFIDDDAEFFTYFVDADGDGVGHPEQSVQVCGPAPVGYVAVAGDCDDDNEEFLAFPWYRDADGDGAGSELTFACEAPDGFVSADGDCDDSDPDVFPGRDEVCKNGIDDDCDPATDCRLRGVIDAVAEGYPSMPLPMGAERMTIQNDFFGSDHPEALLSFSDGTRWLVDVNAGDLRAPILDLGSVLLAAVAGDVTGDGELDVVGMTQQSVRVWEGGASPTAAIEFGGLVDVAGVAAADSHLGPGLWISDEGLEQTFFLLHQDGPTTDAPSDARFTEPVFGYGLGRTACADGAVAIPCSVFGEMGHVFALRDPFPSEVVFDYRDPDLFGSSATVQWIPFPLFDVSGIEPVALSVFDLSTGESLRFPIPLDSSDVESVGPALPGTEDGWRQGVFDCDGDGVTDFHRGSGGTNMSVRYSNHGPADFSILGSPSTQILSGVDWNSDGYADFLVVQTNPWLPDANVVAVVHGSGP